MLSNTVDESQTSTKVRRSALAVSIILGLAVVAVVARNTSATASPVLAKNMSENRVEKDAIGVLKHGLESRLREKRDCLKARRRRRLSWQAYVDTQLVATGSIENAAILSKADGSVWASTPGFVPKTYQIDKLGPAGNVVGKETVNEAKNLASFAATGKFGSQGCRMAGVKYMVVRTDPNGPVMYGKKPKGGICIDATVQAIIVGTYNQDKGQAPGGANAAVENLANYLRDSGYMELFENDDVDC